MKENIILFVKKMTTMEVKLTFVLAAGFEIYSLQEAFDSSIAHFLFTVLLLTLFVGASIRSFKPSNAEVANITLIGAYKCVIFTTLETAIWFLPVLFALERCFGLTPSVQLGLQFSAIILYCILLRRNRSLDWQHEGQKPSEMH